MISDLNKEVKDDESRVTDIHREQLEGITMKLQQSDLDILQAYDMVNN